MPFQVRLSIWCREGGRGRVKVDIEADEWQELQTSPGAFMG